MARIFNIRILASIGLWQLVTLAPASQILLVGDSIAQNAALSLQAQCAGSTVVNKGASGSTFLEWNADKAVCIEGQNCQYSKAFEGSGWTHVWLSLGANDIWNSGRCSLDKTQLKSRLEASIAKIKAIVPTISIVLTAYPIFYTDKECSMSQFLGVVNKGMEEVAAADPAVTFWDSAEACGGTINPECREGSASYFLDKNGKGDGVHFGTACYNRLWSQPALQKAFGCGGPAPPPPSPDDGGIGKACTAGAVTSGNLGTRGASWTFGSAPKRTGRGFWALKESIPGLDDPHPVHGVTCQSTALSGKKFLVGKCVSQNIMRNTACGVFFNAGGTVAWTWVPEMNSRGFMTAAAEAPDGSYLLAFGHVNQQRTIFKLDPTTGVTIFKYTWTDYTNSAFEFGRIDAAGDVYAVGFKDAEGGNWMFKSSGTTDAGQALWQKITAAEMQANSLPTARVQVHADLMAFKHFVKAAQGFIAVDGLRLVKLRDDGTQEWKTDVCKECTHSFTGVAASQDGTAFYTTGHGSGDGSEADRDSAASVEFGLDGKISHFNSQGHWQWTKRYPTPAASVSTIPSSLMNVVFEECWSIEKTPDGGFVIGCGSGTHCLDTPNAAWKAKCESANMAIWQGLVTKISANGDVEWQRIDAEKVESPGGAGCAVEYVTPNPDGTLLLSHDDTGGMGFSVYGGEGEEVQFADKCLDDDGGLSRAAGETTTCMEWAGACGDYPIIKQFCPASCCVETCPKAGGGRRLCAAPDQEMMTFDSAMPMSWAELTSDEKEAIEAQKSGLKLTESQEAALASFGQAIFKEVTANVARVLSIEESELDGLCIYLLGDPSRRDLTNSENTCTAATFSSPASATNLTSTSTGDGLGLEAMITREFMLMILHGGAEDIQDSRTNAQLMQSFLPHLNVNFNFNYAGAQSTSKCTPFSYTASNVSPSPKIFPGFGSIIGGGDDTSGGSGSGDGTSSGSGSEDGTSSGSGSGDGTSSGSGSGNSTSSGSSSGSGTSGGSSSENGTSSGSGSGGGTSSVSPNESNGSVGIWGRVTWGVMACLCASSSYF